MTTSGSTSSPRLVRLSFDNLMANTEGIVDALGIRAEDVAVTTLPLSYWADSTGRRNTSTVEVFRDGGRRLEQEDERCA